MLSIILLSSMVFAQDFKLDISTTKDTYSAGEEISYKVTLLDVNNDPIDAQVDVTIEDAEKFTSFQKTVNTNEIIQLNLGEDASFGYWSLSTNYEGAQSTTLFIIEAQELAKFSLVDNTLTVTNIGNTKYTRTIQIIIGNTIGAKTPRLDMGESVSYKLVAPEGNYDIKVTDGKTTLTQPAVELTGTTGKVVGALDEAASDRAGITGGVSPNEEDDLALLNYVKKSKLVYVFILVVFGAMILLAIERKVGR